MTAPIDLYFWPTPNGWKISIALEEMALPYSTHLVDLYNKGQFDPDFLRVSPNNKIPAITDPDGPDGDPFSVFETGAILLYLAEKTGRLLGDSAASRLTAIQWMMFL